MKQKGAKRSFDGCMDVRNQRREGHLQTFKKQLGGG
jgi:hypothetical protein